MEAIRRKAVLAQLKLVPAPVRHMGTGRTQDVLKGMLDELVDYGVEIHYVETVDQILTENGSVKGIRTKNGEEFYASYVVCAPGRDGSEWLAAESKRLGLSTAVNPVDGSKSGNSCGSNGPHYCYSVRVQVYFSFPYF